MHSTKTVGIAFVMKAIKFYLKYEKNQELVECEQASDGMIRVNITFTEIVHEAPVVAMHPVKLSLLQKMQIFLFRLSTTMHLYLQ